MAKDIERKIWGILVIAVGLMFIIVLATPLILHDDKTYLPRNPRILLDYIEEEDTYILLLNSAAGDHLYYNITYSINGESQFINRSYTIERNIHGGSFNLTVEMFDVSMEKRFFLNMSVSQTVVDDEFTFSIIIYFEDTNFEFNYGVTDFPFRYMIKEVK